MFGKRMNKQKVQIRKKDVPHIIDVVDSKHVGVDIVDVELAGHTPHPGVFLQSGSHLKRIKMP